MKIKYYDYLTRPGIIGYGDWPSFPYELKIRYGNFNNVPDYIDFDFAEEWKLLPEVEGYQHDFRYNNNEFGFRGPGPWPTVDTNYYGCSITYGQGVPWEAVYTNKVDQHFGWTSNNFGISGLGIQEMTNLFLVTSKLTNAKRAVFLFPNLRRYTMAFQQGDEISYSNLNDNIPDRDQDPIRWDLSELYHKLPEAHFMDNFKNCVATILYVARLKGMKVYFSSWLEEFIIFLLKEWTKLYDYAAVSNRMDICHKGRDKSHPGILTHDKFARDLIEVISKKENL